MGFYFPSNEAEGEAVAAQPEAPTTGLAPNVDAKLRSATVMSVIRGNFFYEMNHNVYKTQEEMLEKARVLCSAALDNGDITADESDCILKDLSENWYGGCKCSFIDKFVCIVCSEEIRPSADPDEFDAEMADVANLAKQYEEKCTAVRNKYGSLVLSFANDFIRLYASSLNPEFVEKFK